MNETSLGQMNALLPSSIDLLICSASFEERCLSVPLNIEAARVRQVLVGENLNHKALHGSHPSRLLDRFGSGARLVPLSTHDAIASTDSWIRALGPVADGRPETVVIDVTAFTHEAVLIITRLAVEFFPQATVICAYNVAGEYSLGDALDRKWLSRGIQEVRSVLGYPGLLRPSQRLHLLVLTGFEFDRAIELVRAYEPAVLSLGVGTNPIGDASNAKKNDDALRLIRAVFGSTRDFEFSVHDPDAARIEILRQVESAPGYNVVVAPMNTKLSTIGAAMAAMINPDIQLCYAEATFYNAKNYSRASDRVCLFSLDVSLLQKVISEIEVAA